MWFGVAHCCTRLEEDDVFEFDSQRHHFVTALDVVNTSDVLGKAEKNNLDGF